MPNFPPPSLPVPESIVSGAGFTPGTSTTITLTGTYRFIIVSFDASGQANNTFTLSGQTVTFNAVIPVGVGAVNVIGYA